jgi:hypothetical protein
VFSRWSVSQFCMISKGRIQLQYFRMHYPRQPRSGGGLGRLQQSASH